MQELARGYRELRNEGSRSSLALPLQDAMDFLRRVSSPVSVEGAWFKPLQVPPEDIA
jgi:hypothetical protein